jgi:D-ribose pyranose/furanose isomerase RbsD
MVLIVQVSSIPDVNDTRELVSQELAVAKTIMKAEIQKDNKQTKRYNIISCLALLFLLDFLVFFLFFFLKGAILKKKN